MRLVRHVLSAAGWLAHAVNQANLGDNWTFDRARPGRLLACCGLLGLLAGVLVLEPPMKTNDVVAAVVLIGLDVFMLLGWVTGLVPFAAEHGDSVHLAEAGSSGSSAPIQVRITGVAADSRGVRRGFRQRAADLEISPSGAELAVHWWNAAWSFDPKFRVPYTHLQLSWPRAEDLTRGTAYLTSKTLPAIRVTMPKGRLLLTFDTTSARDDVFAAMVNGKLQHPADH